jgi:hypothetical protein
MRPIILFCVVGLLRKRRVVAHKWPPKAFCLTAAIPPGGGVVAASSRDGNL